jgi:hypothetical protein
MQQAAKIISTEQLRPICNRNMVCFWHKIVNTPHECDNKDDDDNNNNNNNNNNNTILTLSVPN